MSSDFSLPPLLEDAVQGRLDLVILRPILNPPLQIDHSLDLKLHWWGSPVPHFIRVPGGTAEHKIVYDIRCDLSALQRYFDDAKQLEIEVLIGGDSTNVKKDDCSSRPIHYKKRSQWLSGDHVGKLVIPTIKLNARGEFICDCSVKTVFGEQCGSVVVFMLFTKLGPITESSNVILGTKFLKKKNLTGVSSERNLNTSRETNVIQATDHPTLKTKYQNEALRYHAIESPHLKCVSPVCSLSPKSKFSSENYSPRFIPFEKPNRSPSKKESNHQGKCLGMKSKLQTPRSNLSPKAYLKQSANALHIPSRRILETKRCENTNSFGKDPLLHEASKQHSQHIGRTSAIQTNISKASNNSGSEKASNYQGLGNFRAKLFSFVDCGALNLSDLPALIQVCEDLSLNNTRPRPSTNKFVGEEESALSPCDESVIFADQSVFHPRRQKRNECSKSSLGTRVVPPSPSTAMLSQMSRDQDCAYQPNIQKMPSVVINSDLPEIVEREGKRAVIVDRDVNNSESKKSPSTSVEIDKLFSNESSILMLQLHSVDLDASNFNGERSSIPSSAKHPWRSQKSANHVVRVKSKVCFFVEASVNSCLELQSSSHVDNAHIFVSRRLQDQTVSFGETLLFNLPPTHNQSDDDTTLMLRISRRRLGNRTREYLGANFVSLNTILPRVAGQDGVVISIPFWSHTRQSINRLDSFESSPAGWLHLSIAFAFSTLTPSNLLPESNELSFPIAISSRSVESANLRNSPLVSHAEREAIDEKTNSAEAKCNNDDPSLPGHNQAFHVSGNSSGIRTDRIMDRHSDINSEKSLTTEQSQAKSNDNVTFGVSQRPSSEKYVDNSINQLELNQAVKEITKCSSRPENITPIRPNPISHSPTPEREPMTDQLNQDVFIEITEGNALPLLKHRLTQQTTAPNAYVQAVVPSVSIQTSVCVDSASPRWNYSKSFTLNPESLQETDHFLVLKVFHCSNGSSPSPQDPLLGFAAVDSRFLWNSFVSLCGWLPIVNLQSEIAGEIKVSLTPKRSRSWFSLPQKEVVSVIVNDSVSKSASSCCLSSPSKKCGIQAAVGNVTSTSERRTNIGQHISKEDTSTFLNTTFIDLSTEAQSDSLPSGNASRNVPKKSSEFENVAVNDDRINAEKTKSSLPSRSCSPKKSIDGKNSGEQDKPTNNHKLEDHTKESRTIASPQTTQLSKVPLRSAVESVKDDRRIALESFQWMNRDLLFDPPSVSYVELTPRNSNPQPNIVSTVDEPSTQPTKTRIKPRKRRLAAKFPSILRDT